MTRLHHHHPVVGRQSVICHIACVGAAIHVAMSLHPFTIAFSSTATPCAVHAKLFPSPSFGRTTNSLHRMVSAARTSASGSASGSSAGSKEAENAQDRERETPLQKSEMLLEGIHELEASLKNLNHEAISHAVAKTTASSSSSAENAAKIQVPTTASATTAAKNTDASASSPAIKPKEAKAIQMDRAAFRLDGLEVHAVVSALTLATSIQFFDISVKRGPAKAHCEKFLLCWQPFRSVVL